MITATLAGGFLHSTTPSRWAFYLYGDMSLTPKQEKFCQTYIQTGNATEAYRQSYSVENMKPETVNRNAKAQMDHSKISARITELQHGLAKKYELTTENVIAELAKIVHADLRKLVSEHGSVLPVHAWPDDMAAAIASIEVTETSVDGAAIGTTKKVKLWDKNSAIEKAMKHLGLFEKDNKQRPTVVIRNLAGPDD